jgi:hypothetical protein
MDMLFFDFSSFSNNASTSKHKLRPRKGTTSLMTALGSLVSFQAIRTHRLSITHKLPQPTFDLGAWTERQLRILEMENELAQRRTQNMIVY